MLGRRIAIAAAAWIFAVMALWAQAPEGDPITDATFTVEVTTPDGRTLIVLNAAGVVQTIPIRILERIDESLSVVIGIAIGRRDTGHLACSGRCRSGIGQRFTNHAKG